MRVCAIFFVITGGPSVGKTTIITLLRQRGYMVVDEMATAIIKEGKFLPWVDRITFQQEVLRRQQSAESGLLKEGKPIFLDRGLFDGEAYYMCDGLPIPPIFSNLDSSHYLRAFLVEPLPFFDNNGVRFEDLEFTAKISPVIANCYASRGIPVTPVPPLSRQERVDLVVKTALESLSHAAPLTAVTSYAAV